MIVTRDVRGLVAPSRVLEKREHYESHHRGHGDRLEVYGEVEASPREDGRERLGPVNTCVCVFVWWWWWVSVKGAAVRLLTSMTRSVASFVLANHTSLFSYILHFLYGLE